MKILIVGGTGVISTDLVLICSQKGFEVTCINRGMNRAREITGVKYLYTDASIENSIKSVIGNEFYDVVVDCISYDTIQLQKTLNSVKDICTQFVFISTIAVFEPCYNNEIISESSPKTNKWDYGVKKVNCEELLKTQCKKMNISYTIIRPAITFNKTRIPFGLISKPNHYTLLKRIQDNKPVIMWDDGEWRMTLTSSYDLSCVLIKLFKNEKAYNDDYNIACGEVLSWNEVVRVYEELLDTKIKLINIPSKEIEANFPEVADELTYNKGTHIVVSQEKLSNVIGEYNCVYSFKDAVKETFDYYLDNQKVQKINSFWDIRVDKLIIEKLGRKKAKGLYKNFNATYMHVKIKTIEYYLRSFYGNTVSKFK